MLFTAFLLFSCRAMEGIQIMELEMEACEKPTTGRLKVTMCTLTHCKPVLWDSKADASLQFTSGMNHWKSMTITQEGQASACVKSITIPGGTTLIPPDGIQFGDCKSLDEPMKCTEELTIYPGCEVHENLALENCVGVYPFNGKNSDPKTRLAQTSIYHCMQACQADPTCVKGIKWKVIPSAEPTAPPQKICKFLDESCDMTRPGGSPWTVIDRDCIDGDRPRFTEDHLPACQYDDDADLCDPPQAECRAGACTTSSCTFKAITSYPAKCLMPLRPEAFIDTECGSNFNQNLGKLINEKGIPQCDKLEGWGTCEHRAAAKAEPKSLIKEQPRSESIKTGLVGGIVLLTDAILDMMEVHPLVKAGIGFYVLVRGCTDFTCTEEDCGDDCFLEEVQQYVANAIDKKLEEYEDQSYRKIVQGVQFALQQFNMLSDEEKFGERGRIAIGSLDTILLCAFGQWGGNAGSASEASLMYFMTFASIHISIKHIMLDLYPSETTRKQYVNMLEKYIDFAERQRSGFIKRRLEKDISLDKDVGEGNVMKIVTRERRAASYVITDSQCPNLNAKVPIGYLAPLGIKPCSADKLDLYAEAVAKFCEYEYKEKQLRPAEEAFWDENVGSIIRAWETLAHALEQNWKLKKGTVPQTNAEPDSCPKLDPENANLGSC